MHEPQAAPSKATGPSLAKRVSLIVLATLMTLAGVMHFVNPEFYLKIMPDYLPWHHELVWLSGVFEVALGLALFIPGLRRAAAWGMIALLIAVFPANIYAFQHQDLLPAPPLVHLLRLPLQGLFILWAYWHTRPDGVPGRGSVRGRPAPHSEVVG